MLGGRCAPRASSVSGALRLSTAAGAVVVALQGPRVVAAVSGAVEVAVKVAEVAAAGVNLESSGKDKGWPQAYSRGLPLSSERRKSMPFGSMRY
jgi:hypothetical protein